MSSNTPNLNLVLPVGSEHVSRAIINENNTKIDTGFGTLSEQITYEKLTTATDFNTLRGNTKLKQYRGEDISIHTNKPSEVTGAYPFALELIPIGDNYTRQILHIYGSGTRTWKRQRYYSGGSPVWSDWVSVDEQINTLNSKLITGTTLSNVDLNNYKETGLYIINGNITNSPTGNYGFMFVVKEPGSIVRQIYFPQGSNTMYLRRYYEGAWLSWYVVIANPSE